MALTKVELLTFRETGENEMKMNAPECMYDSAVHIAFSPGPVHVESGDGKFTIEGEGFFWRQSDNSFTVSNRVHSFIASDLLKTNSLPPRTNANGDEIEPIRILSRTNANNDGVERIQIFSDHFHYDGKSGIADYTGHLRVVGTNLSLTSSTLKIKMSAHTNQLESLTADENVVFDYGQIQATGRRAVYTTASNIVELFGNPGWRLGQREGHADGLLIDRSNNILHATGHAYLKTPVSGQGSIFTPQKNSAATNETAVTNRFLEVLSDNYALQTNLAVFRGKVLATDQIGGQPQGTLRADTLTVSFSESNEVQTATAERNVVIQQRDSQFTGRSAIYTATNGLLWLRGAPTWRAGLREGRGDELRANLAQNEMRAIGHAWMKLPANQITPSNPASTNSPSPAKTAAGTNTFAQIFSDEYTVGTNQAWFLGHVRVDHPEMKMNSETMTAQFSEGNADKQIVAERGVILDLVDEKGQEIHGTSDKAIYNYRVTATATNETLDLLGRSKLDMAQGTWTGDILKWDRVSHTIIGPKSTYVTKPGAVGTNAPASKKKTL